MMSKIDEVFRRVLNDKEIFDSPYDRNTRASIPKLFEGDSWKELGRLFNESRKDEFIEKIDSRIREIENQERRARGWRRDKINELKQRAEWLKSAFDNKPNLLKNLFENLEWYGLVECKLPRMEDYGKVIERYDISIVEQYFVDKIKGASYPQNRALEKILEYVKELHTTGISPEEIAYLVRKIDSLAKYWEVIE
ncbi:MAG: hypothetical protein N2V74_03615 [Candidatus Methanospirare jalkutatii]|nr:MAG: hypothetical protein N2V74_02245 [Candidatus Methanospirare jalkutatii]UYZ40794.1 MAG: hypothetical protein N2V74_03615 [Candidatus Methanospirare jalkutatii]